MDKKNVFEKLGIWNGFVGNQKFQALQNDGIPVDGMLQLQCIDIIIYPGEGGISSFLSRQGLGNHPASSDQSAQGLIHDLSERLQSSLVSIVSGSLKGMISRSLLLIYFQR